MADVKQAVDAVLREEDSKLSGVIANLKDGAGWTRFGITSKNHPELIPLGFFDADRMDATHALVAAEKVLSQAYAVPLRIADIPDQALADAVLSFGINAGTNTSARILQESCNQRGLYVATDGVIGPSTLSAIKMLSPLLLLTTFCAKARAYYHQLADANPNDRQFVKGWDNRVTGWLVEVAA